MANAHETTCALCGHCVAVCPTGAITHAQMDMANFIGLERSIRFDRDAFVQLVRGRRSHRAFKEQAIPRQDLEKLVDLCRYTPTGANRQTVAITIIQDRRKIQHLSDHTVDFYEHHSDELIEEARAYEAAGKEVPPLTKSAMTILDTVPLLVKARTYGMEVIFHRAPAVMVFHAPTETSTTPKDDCVIASTTVTMAARIMSLETCYIGIFEFVANRYAPIIEALSLPPGHKVFSVLVLGYPQFTFLRTVDRKPIKARWL